MSRKTVQTDWLNEDYSANQDKLPTIRQYLKELPKDVKDIKSTVRIVWLPGKWDNYTLQTDLFRVSISRNHKLYRGLRDNLDEFTRGNATLDIIVTDRDTASYRLNINSQESGEWFFIGGDSGLKFTSDTNGSGATSDIPF